MSMDYAVTNTNARTRLLSLLSDCQWHNCAELEMSADNRYGARLGELRNLGYDVETKPDPNTLDSQGRLYRLTSPAPGAPREKRVKVYLTEQDARSVILGAPTMFAIAAVRNALHSFQQNKGKL